ncbi:PTS sugar transporter subunit IIA [Aerococcaceae bacterium DSM 111022]|nr:PTS sugar transporter subunit IIA [Aerococcaceae bacterium DSM 111022]
MLKKSITKDLIDLNVDASNWEDAIKNGANLLKEEGYISDEYITQIIDNVHENGPYIVIAPGIALAHASADGTVYKNGVSIITLKKPVEFSHEQNDPVNLIITFAAIDADEHLTTIQDIVTLLDDSEFMGLTQKSEDKEELYKYIMKL